MKVNHIKTEITKDNMYSSEWEVGDCYVQVFRNEVKTFTTNEEVLDYVSTEEFLQQVYDDRRQAQKNYSRDNWSK
ncbi:hypothetical protein AB8Q02_06895 [Enterobacter ludwigii]|uniref:hypothetical protein n=1 Tax=Enterobacteriaceae TaxID=543 RepID=UPI000B5142B7|nr:hypothetical protein [Escherichia coli]